MSRFMIDTTADKVMFSSLNLDAQILRAIEEEGYTEATAIQGQGIREGVAGGGRGVATRFSTPFASAGFCVVMSMPPNTTVERSATCRE